MSNSIEILLRRNLDVFGENDPSCSSAFSQVRIS
jgi:hypothetical protein